MGGRGTFLKEGGFTEQHWNTTGLLHDVKVLQRKDPKARIGLPSFSNTPGTMYIAINREGKFHQLRKYNDDRSPVLDVDYGIDTPLTGRGESRHSYTRVHQ